MKKMVVHCKIEKFDVYIGRPSEWGNPYTHKDGTIAKFKTDTPEEAVSKYREYVLNNPELMNKIHQLKGKVLGCWCKTNKNPNAPCHGDVLVDLANKT